MSNQAQIIEKEGKRKYVMLPYDEYLQLCDAKRDLDELKTFREAKELREESPWSGAGFFETPGPVRVREHEVSDLALRWLKLVKGL
jgi:hypothetical protein